jgi:hypothetical protein
MPLRPPLLPLWRRRARAVGLAACALGAASCGGGSDGDDIACTAEARASVMLTVVDASNAPVADARVSYRVDGGALQSLNCGAAGVCAVGFEVRGVFEITVEATGYAPASRSAAVTGDVCHVATVGLTVVLAPAP